MQAHTQLLRAWGLSDKLDVPNSLSNCVCTCICNGLINKHPHIFTNSTRILILYIFFKTDFQGEFIGAAAN